MLIAFFILAAIVLFVVIAVIKTYNPSPVEERADFDAAFGNVDSSGGTITLVKLDEYEEETYFSKN